MERFDFFQEPLQPTTVETQLFEFWERAEGVHPRIVGELGAFNQIKDDGVF